MKDDFDSIKVLSTKSFEEGILVEVEHWEKQAEVLCEWLKQYRTNREREGDPTQPPVKKRKVVLLGRGPAFKRVFSEFSDIAKMVQVRRANVKCEIWRMTFSCGPDDIIPLTLKSSTVKILQQPLRPKAKLIENTSPVDEGRQVLAIEDIEEPTCRICQAKKSETPNQALLQPCLCSGSLAYVHPTCLNQWRLTSQAAYKSCSICHFKYRMKKNLRYEYWLDRGKMLWKVVAIMIALAFICGFIVMLGMNYYQNISKEITLRKLYGVSFPLSSQSCLRHELHVVDNDVIINTNWGSAFYSWKVVYNAGVWAKCHFTMGMIQAMLFGFPVIAVIGCVINIYRAGARPLTIGENRWSGLITFCLLFFSDKICRPLITPVFLLLGSVIFVKDILQEGFLFSRKYSPIIIYEVIDRDRNGGK